MASLGRVLVVDDEEIVRWTLARALERRGYVVDTASSASEAISKTGRQAYSAVFMDICMPEMNGLAAMEEIRGRPEAPFVVIVTGQDTMQNTIDAMRKGAYDYLVKPFDLEEVYLLLGRIGEELSRRSHVSALQKELRRPYEVGEIVGVSEAMRRVLKTVGRVAGTDVTVLIQGESGTGKELIARSIHYNSRRIGHPFEVVNCAAIPADLLESELFGHEKGAFTGAIARRLGKFELADGGTVFLDEVGDMAPAAQSKVLRVIQEREFERVGGRETIRVDVRIIAATNRELASLVAEKRFREDLYYRLNVVPISIPPLRERREDVAHLIRHFISRFCAELETEPKRLTEEALRLLVSYHWPGNVRELENAILRAMVLAPGPSIFPEHLPPDIAPAAAETSPEREVDALLERHLGKLVAAWDREERGGIYSHALGLLERVLLKLVLERTRGNQVRAAEILGINRNTLRKKLAALKGSGAEG